MATVLGANTLAAGGFDVANSCRFNDGSNDNLSKTFDAQNTRTKHSISFWCKRATLGHTQFLFEGSDGTYPSHIYFSSGNALAFYDSGENATFVTTALFRDPTAWMHILCRIDTTQAANANRVRFYVNGVLSATAQTNAINTSSTKANNLAAGARASASAAQLAIDNQKAQASFTATGMVMNTIGQSPNFKLAEYGTTTRFFDGLVAEGEKTRIQAAGVHVFGDNTTTFGLFDANGIKFVDDDVTTGTFTAGTVTLFGASADDKITINASGVVLTEGGTDRLSLGSSTITLAPDISAATTDSVVIAAGGVKIFDNAADYIHITSDGLKIYESSALQATIGSTITLGPSTDRVTIDSNGIVLREGNADIITIADGEIEVSGSILEKTRLFGSGEDGTVILYHNTVEATFEPGGASATTSNTAAGTAATIRSGTVHTMQQDCYFKALTLSATGGTPSLVTNGFRLFIKDSLTIGSGCAIHNDGTNASGATAGEGGGGGTLSQGSDGTTGGEGGASSPIDEAQSGADGGGGGGSGGFVFISARVIANSGVIRSHGGTGAAGGSV